MKESEKFDSDFEKVKIVAWLLNRSKEAQSSERQLFFDSLNRELELEYEFYGGNSTKVQPQVHDTENGDATLLLDHNQVNIEMTETMPDAVGDGTERQMK